MNPLHLSRTWAGAVVLMAFSTAAAGADTRLVSYEGMWGDAIEEVVASGGPPPVEVIRYSGSLEGLTETGAALVDVESQVADFLCDNGPAQPLDDRFRTALTVSAGFPGMAHPCGVGYLVTSLVLVAEDGGPDSWAGFFDTGAYPGARALPRGARGTLEITAMASGVLPDDVYDHLAEEDGIAATLDALDVLFRETQIVFWDTPEDALALLRAGAVSAAALPSPHAAELVLDDPAFAVSFAGQLHSVQRMVLLPPAARRPEATLNVLRKILSPGGQAALATRLFAGPVTADAWQFIPEEIAPLLPTWPQYDLTRSGLAEDADFWSAGGRSIEERFAIWLRDHETGSPGPTLP